MRLIDADALKKDLVETKEDLWKIYNGLTHHVEKQICAGQIGTFQEIILRIKDAPTIEADSVKHGRWEEVVDNDEFWGELFCPKCSVCGSVRMMKHNYCPNCGAKMDLED